MWKRIRFFFIVLLLISISGGCCSGKSNYLAELIPEASIIYLPYLDRKDSIGYFDSVTLDPKYLKPPEPLVKLTWLPDFQTFFGLSWYRFLAASQNPSIWGPYSKDFTESERIESLTNKYSIYNFTEEEKQIFLGDESRIWLFDLDTEEVLLYLPDPIIYKNSFEYNEISYDRVSNCLFAEVRADQFDLDPKDSIQRYCLDKKEWEFVTSGRNPQVSPDGKQLALTRDDGMYLFHFVENTETKVISKDFTNQDVISPHPQWSSDSKKIVFHFWIPESDHINKAHIYLLNLVNNKCTDTRIIGIYPSFKN
ncbi:MAG: hypothetical protein AAGU15_09770 [Anaerolineaceae bacterium]|jgi:Tol biopolymer transport system component